ncbi:hypothetical protein BTR14_15585 [Rhizobium rhizosphaerae]|uniref:Nif11 domain-containing protein n=1 Tax=Xaviernesmea rhizosphaerae TaxID=1672749 RepID=A0ABX3PCA5_9HYPH|nr:hypothetical protein [Xaviernesmea rhizosphaerae]OQP85600.1 hypothetical protein BTR14_15585 [Xaviernesmea rhizosphaerae]
MVPINRFRQRMEFHLMTSPAAATSVLASSARAQGCEEAIRPAFTRLAEAGDLDLAAAVGPDLPAQFEPLIATAEAEGWERDEVEQAVRSLVQQRLGAQGAAID